MSTSEARIFKLQAGRPSEPIELGEERETINAHYRSINELVAKSHNTFQKLYNRKEKVLIEGLHQQFEEVVRSLQHYEEITSVAYIEERCKQKKEQLQHSRFEMLREYMTATDDFTSRKKELAEAAARLQELRADMGSTRELLQFICSQNSGIERQHSELAEESMHQPLFPTEPVKYMSPYAVQTIARQGKAIIKKRKPKFLQPFAGKPTDGLLPVIFSLYQSKYQQRTHSNNESQFALEVLDQKQLRQLMISVLQSR